MLNKIEFKKIRDFGETINDTFQFVKQNFKHLMKVYFYMCGFFIIATAITSTMQQLNVQNTNFYGGGNVGAMIYKSLFSVQYFYTGIVTFATYTAMSVAMLSFIAIYVENGKTAATVEQVWAYFKYYYFRMLLSNFILTLFMILCLLPCGIPFIYIFPAMSIFYPVMIMENGSFSYSFNRSFKLVKDNWGLTAGTLVILAIITYATMYFASIPAMILTYVSVITKGSNGTNVLAVGLSSIIHALCQVFLILPIIGAALCYYNLKERHENTGLMARINEIGVDKEKTDLDGEY